jgi:hypothetical protein
MTTDRVVNFLVYRDNAFWQMMAEDVLLRAATIEVRVDRKRTYQKVDQLIVHIFPEGTPMADVELWISSHHDDLRAARRVYCDGTVYGVVQSLPYETRPATQHLEHLVEHAVKRIFGESAPADIYRDIFTLLVANAGIKCVQIVLDNISDGNPLQLNGFDADCRRYSMEKLMQYAEAFKRLIPSGTEVVFIRAEDLTIPNAETLILGHHHGVGICHRLAEELRPHPRLLMSYASGFIPKASQLCDLSSVVKGDLLGSIRSAIRPR